MNYLDKQKKFFEDTHHLMTVENHARHNNDPEYWNILLKEIKENPQKWTNKVALDFGCGCGRNIKNLLDMAKWARVDGCDISNKNQQYSKEFVRQFYPAEMCNTWENNGKDIRPAKDDEYDFIMSHIVFQHISDYDTRFSLLKDFFRCLKSEGLVSLHYMDLTESVSYYTKTSDFKNCRVENPQFLIDDFQEIGYKNITCETGIDIFNGCKTYYIKGSK